MNSVETIVESYVTIKLDLTVVRLEDYISIQLIRLFVHVLHRQPKSLVYIGYPKLTVHNEHKHTLTHSTTTCTVYNSSAAHCNRSNASHVSDRTCVNELAPKMATEFRYYYYYYCNY